MTKTSITKLGISSSEFEVWNLRFVWCLFLGYWDFRHRVSRDAVGPQLKYAWRLFIKNTAPCELVRGCIGGDT
ncbi:MAG: hypothetical protein A2836_02255 [Candidatus Taylorbacteria bacterium RIFCSPHIGHO2_01_FULL_45_63]|nr:MAG: hypothetical protein A2836_02255 [Candidatus Taylorbacteria bacterium RIFCSPHIGHO2_01_FULL_45_63]